MRGIARAVSVYDIERQREDGERWERRMRGEEPAYVAPPLPELPLLQQIALIQASESQVKRALLARMGEVAQAKPDWHDYRRLVEAGYACKRVNDRWHSLTAEGSILARKLTRALCKQYDVHLLQDGGATRFDVIFRCSCGDWSTRVPKGRATNGNAYFRFEQYHLAKVKQS